MNKIALANRVAAMLAQITVADASSMTSSASPTSPVQEGAIFDDFALLGALVFGAGDLVGDGHRQSTSSSLEASPARTRAGDA